MKIKEFKVVLPSLIKVNYLNKDYNIFAYVDKENVIIINDDDFPVKDELKNVILDYMKTKTPVYIMPEMPKSGFDYVKNHVKS